MRHTCNMENAGSIPVRGTVVGRCYRYLETQPKAKAIRPTITILLSLGGHDLYAVVGKVRFLVGGRIDTEHNGTCAVLIRQR